jgi:hypothetical protein
MFNWFNKKPVAQVTEPIKTVVTPLPPLPPQDEIAYQIGKTESGKTTLRLGDGYSMGTLRMNDEGLVKLIEMLTAALDTDAEETEGHDGRGPG